MKACSVLPNIAIRNGTEIDEMAQPDTDVPPIDIFVPAPNVAALQFRHGVIADF